MDRDVSDPRGVAVSAHATGARTAGSRQGVTLLGSTGSIGINTLDVLAKHPERYRVVALTANTQVDRLYEQCQRFRPQRAVMLDSDAAGRLAEKLRLAGVPTEVSAGNQALADVAASPEAQIVVAAIVGAAGLLPTLAAVRAGKRVLIANKEPLVMSGGIFIEEARKSGAQILPVDSEHNAIFQCMPNGFVAGGSRPEVRRVLLTCSGGPFRTWPADRLVAATPEQACAHPNWVMGRKISVDSATLMNKGLELIEACWLFGLEPEKVEVVVHPQSVIHSLVDYTDGSVLAQLGNPDMRTPIAHALAWPERIESGVRSLDLLEIAHLDFGAPDTVRFPCLRLAYEAAHAGGTAPTVLNAANEIAVQAFLDHEIAFTEIAQIIEATLDRSGTCSADLLSTILAEDEKARRLARELVHAHGQARQASARSTGGGA
ncbi:MAG: 1-deoxy-D-xylulose-5-phosphate reductoisomerase [Pseudomonadota bacterium]|nr:MAG: 1-deoxy-D-xylulose-5-phosphate reductoisomerase [Pseudomonadota bacterium]